MKKFQMRENTWFVSRVELLVLAIILIISFLLSLIPGMAEIGILLAGSAIGIIAGGSAILMIFALMSKKILIEAKSTDKRELAEDDEW